MSKKPDLIAYAVRNRGKNQKAIWLRVGAAWKNQSGYSIELEAFPVSGRIVLVEPKAEAAEDSEPQAA